MIWLKLKEQTTKAKNILQPKIMVFKKKQVSGGFKKTSFWRFKIFDHYVSLKNSGYYLWVKSIYGAFSHPKL